jgi:YVTN family beta-propeller protein
MVRSARRSIAVHLSAGKCGLVFLVALISITGGIDTGIVSHAQGSPRPPYASDSDPSMGIVHSTRLAAQGHGDQKDRSERQRSGSTSIPFVNETLVLANNSLEHGNFAAANGYWPTGVAYDPTLGEVAVADDQSDILSVISDTTDRVVAGVVVGIDPDSVVYDSGYHEFFVSNFNSGNLSVVSDKNDTVIATIPVGGGPSGLAYDSSVNEVYVANYYSGNVSVISDLTNTVVASIPVGSDPTSVLFDSGLEEIFVANEDSNNLSVIDSASNKVLTSVWAGPAPAGLAYDPVHGEVFVADSHGDNVSVVSDASDRLIGNITVNGAPTGLSYDRSRSELFVSYLAGPDGLSVLSTATDTVLANVSVPDNYGGLIFGPASQDVADDSAKGEAFVAIPMANVIAVVSDSTYALVHEIPLGEFPSVLAYDSGRRSIYVAEGGYSGLGVVSDQTNTVVGNVSIFGVTGLAYDSGKGEVFALACCYSGNAASVAVISDSTNQVIAVVSVGNDSAPFGGLAYDNAKGEIFVANTGSDNVSVISDATNTVVASIPVGRMPTGIAYDPDKGEVFVADDGSGNVSVISDDTDQIVATIPVPGPTGLVFDSGKGEIFVDSYFSGNVSVISDSTNALVATISVPSGYYAESLGYDSGQGEIFDTGAYNDNNVSVLSDVTDSLVVTVPVGLAPWGAVYDIDNGATYVTNNRQGTLSIITQGAYPITFKESGLPAGTRWSVELNGVNITSTSLGITFSEPNGTYSFAVAPVPPYQPDPFTGNVSVRGAAQNTTILFTAIYEVTFTETGLPGGVLWYLNISGSPSLLSTYETVTIYLANGSYSYSVASSNRLYAAVVGLSSFAVSGAALNEIVLFLMVTYPVTVMETGLTPGTNWSATVSGSTGWSMTPSIVFSEGNGTYEVRIGAVPGFVANESATSITVRGLPESLSIQFAATGTGPAKFLGLPATTGYAVLGGIALAAAIVGLVLVVTHRRRKGPPSVVNPPEMKPAS